MAFGFRAFLYSLSFSFSLILAKNLNVFVWLCKIGCKRTTGERLEREKLR